MCVVVVVVVSSLRVGCQASTNIHTSHMDNKVSSVDSPSVMSRVTDQDSLAFPTLV